MVNVTIEALQTVKNAMNVFKADIDGISKKSNAKIEKILGDCKAKVSKAKQDIVNTETKIQGLEKEMDFYESKILEINKELNYLESSIPDIHSKIHEIYNEISNYKLQISLLRSQLSDTEDDSRRQQIQSQINAIEGEIHSCELYRIQLETQAKNAEIKKTELQGELSLRKSDKLKCETELCSEKNRCNNQKNKLERLNTAFSKVESDLMVYINTIKKFEASSVSRTGNNISSVDKCISSVDDYISASI